MTIRHSVFFVVAIGISCYFDQTCCLPTNSKVVECNGIKLTKLGCYKDSMKQPRPLPQLMLTDRDTTSPVYSGVLIKWRQWDAYMVDLICRCATKALSKGYNKIGLQYYGECWSGPNSATSRYTRDGSSESCVTFGYKPCKRGLDCIGKKETNFVYEVKKVPSGSPTRKPTTKTPSATPSPSPTPSGSATSTAKRPNNNPTSSNPCQTPSCSNTGQQQQQQPQTPCEYPPCLQQPVVYPGVPIGCPQAQCPAQCASQCTLSCCNSWK